MKKDNLTISDLKAKLEYHKAQAERIESALRLLETIDTVQVSNGHAVSKPIQEYNPAWNDEQKFLYFIVYVLKRFAFSSELQELYKEKHPDLSDDTVKDRAYQGMFRLKQLEEIISYQPNGEEKKGGGKKGYAWGKKEWLGQDGNPKSEYLPKRQQKKIMFE